MNESKRKTVGTGTYIGLAVSVILILLLVNPAWLPLSGEMKEKLTELEKTHFLIERSSRITIAHIITLVLALCVVWLIYTLIKLALNALGKKSERARTIATLLVNALKYLAAIIALVWGLSILGVNSTAVLAGVGIIGLILGFGAQSLIEDVLTGLFIIFEGKYSIGDIIVLDDFRGTVRDIGVRTTTIEDAGYNLKVVNNSDIRNFQNRSRNASLAICEVSVSYDTDLPALEKMLAANLPAMYAPHKDLYLAAPRYLGTSSLADSGVNLKFVVDCKEENVFAAQRQLTRDIRVLFAEKNVEIPFPQVVVHKGE
ncbi:MAG: mechanosensitive ion channel family protein [Solobacterium sp.]|nr:mechanosensitive ion channel family protein [Solobacterium sp.]